MEKHYFHGTTLEKSLRILEDKELKGNFYYLDQRNAYVSLSDNMVFARQYGKVIFVLKNLGTCLIKVRTKNQKWIRKNLEIMQHVYQTRFVKNNIPFAELKESGEGTYCVIDTLPLTDDNVEEILIFDNDYERLEETREMFQEKTTKKITTIIEPAILPEEYWINLQEDFKQSNKQF